jgi:hypothetical protein
MGGCFIYHAWAELLAQSVAAYDCAQPVRSLHGCRPGYGEETRDLFQRSSNRVLSAAHRMGVRLALLREVTA